MKEYEDLLLTPPDQGARKHGKTSYELGQLELLREQLASRFGSLSEEANKTEKISCRLARPTREALSA